MKEIIPGILYQAERRCPHADAIQFCPLYRAAHEPALADIGCLGNDWSAGECEVDEGASYVQRVHALRERAPAFAAEAAADRQQHERLQQINRNMEMAGLKPRGRP